MSCQLRNGLSISQAAKQIEDRRDALWPLWQRTEQPIDEYSMLTGASLALQWVLMRTRGRCPLPEIENEVT